MTEVRKIRIGIREMYILLILSITMLFALIYSSMALFEKSIEKIGIASIVASDINFTLTSDETNFNISGNYGTITVEAGETKTFKITLQNQNVNSARYKMYYRFSNDITILNVEVGISNNSDAELTDIIEVGTSKTIEVVITNNSTQQATIEIGAQGGYAANNTIVLNTGRNEMEIIQQGYVDPSGANQPILASGMIPVIYDETCNENEGCWKVADTTTAWYSYNDQKWANAVTVNETASTCTEDCVDTIEKRDRAYYIANIDAEISMDDINTMWVWIPRYKYKISSNLGSTTGLVQPPEIDVVFEKGTNTTGVDEATYRAGITEEGTNDNYYTHPAFRDGNTVYKEEPYDIGGWDKELTGIWVGKFETGGTADNPLIKPDIKSFTNTLSEQFLTSLKISGGSMDPITGEVTFAGNNVYGLNDVDTRTIKNTEWGAVAYLSQSKYGKRGNKEYEGSPDLLEIYTNNSYSSYTGRSAGFPYPSMPSAIPTEGSHRYMFDKLGQGASTTGTIYGIYDMVGGSIEGVMANYDGQSGYSSVSNSGFNGLCKDGTLIENGISFPESKYYDKYITSEINKSSIILGDATWETMNWYSDRVNHSDNISIVSQWISRSNSYSGSPNDTLYGIFSTNASNGDSGALRVVLIK